MKPVRVGKGYGSLLAHLVWHTNPEKIKASFAFSLNLH